MLNKNLSFKSLPYVELSMGLNTSPVCLQTILPAHFTPRFFLALDGKFKCLNWILIYFVPHLTFGMTAFGRQIFGRNRKLKIRFQASAKTTFRHLVFLNMRHVPRRVRIASPTTSFDWFFFVNGQFEVQHTINTRHQLINICCDLITWEPIKHDNVNNWANSYFLFRRLSLFEMNVINCFDVSRRCTRPFSRFSPLKWISFGVH